MSFKKFSLAHGAPAKGGPDDKSKVAATADRPATQAGKGPAAIAPAAKS